MIDDDVRHRLDSVLKQRLEGRAVLVEAAVTIVQSKILLGVIARAEIAGVGGRWHPDQVETAILEGGRNAFHDLVPALVAKIRKLRGTPVPVRFPVKSLQHDAIVFEARLRPQHRRTSGNQKENDCGSATTASRNDAADNEPGER